MYCLGYNIDSMWIICVIVIFHLDIATNEKLPDEFCEQDTFVAECSEDEVILMESAKYGRMLRGGCLKRQENIGCSADVSNFFDSRCSGRIHCEVKVHDLMEYSTRCQDNDLRNHLIAKYRCVTVYQPKKNCYPKQKTTISHSSSGYLSSYVTGKTECGTIDSPWVITAGKHQTISLKFIDFTTAKNSVVENPGSCRVLVVVKEIVKNSKSLGDTSETVCGGLGRERHIFRRMAEEVQIRFVPRHNDEEEMHFLVQYEVSGCPEIPISAGTELVYTMDGAVIKCGGLEAWKVTCKNNKWHGAWRNCSTGGDSDGPFGGVVMSSVMSLPYSTAIILVVSIAVAIGGCVLLMGLCYVRRRRRLRMEANNSLASQGRLPKNLDRFPPPYEDTSYTVPDANNSYQQHSWVQQQQQHHYRHAQLTTGNGNNINNNLNNSSANPDSYQQRYVEHIYESPNFYRKEYESKSAPNSLQYYEVENAVTS